MIVIIDYGLGNLGSIKNMLYKLGFQSIISSTKEDINAATKLILPGVGAFDKGMLRLKEQGLVEVLNKRVLNDKVPTLGICLGMQLMTSGSEEGQEPGLGWIEGKCVKFQFSDKQLKVPHMGWNYISKKKETSLISQDIKYRYYFVHSYYVQLENEQDNLFSTKYGSEFTAAFQKDNIIGVQFHPEKSHKYGMELLQSFASN